MRDMCEHLGERERQRRRAMSDGDGEGADRKQPES